MGRISEMRPVATFQHTSKFDLTEHAIDRRPLTEDVQSPGEDAVARVSETRLVATFQQIKSGLTAYAVNQTSSGLPNIYGHPREEAQTEAMSTQPIVHPLNMIARQQ